MKLSLKRGFSHAAHLLMEAAIGCLGLGALAGCVLAWRLGEGPIDVTGLARRALASVLVSDTAGSRVSIGHAALAWEGFSGRDSPLDFRVDEMRIATGTGMPVHVPHGRVTLSVPSLLRGRVAPRRVEIDGARLEFTRDRAGRLSIDLPEVPGGRAGATGAPAMLRDFARPAGSPSSTGMPWLSQLQEIRVRDFSATLRDAALGVTWEVPRASIDLHRGGKGGGGGGGATLELSAGAITATVSVKADLREDGVGLSATMTRVSPASLAALAPGLAVLGVLDAPTRVSMTARLDASLRPVAGTLVLAAGAGTVHAGRGAIAIREAGLRLAATAAGVDIEELRIAWAAAVPAHGAAPTLLAHGTAGWDDGRPTLRFAADIDTVPFADLAAYWPDIGHGGARPWITANVVGGRAYDAHAEGILQSDADFSAPALTALAGSLEAEDLTVFWLRPVPPLLHGRAHLVIDGPDVLRILVQSASQDRMTLPQGVVRIYGLSAKDQFADFDFGLNGPVEDMLHLLAHPRLNLLSRRPLQASDPSGEVAARVKIHLPLEAGVTMEQIPVSVSADISALHLGRIALGRDLDHAAVRLRVDGDGLAAAGDGAFAGVPASLAVDMDFRAGQPGQVLQHVRASAQATAAQLAKAGLPAGLIPDGSAAIRVDYADRRDGSGEVSVDADLGGAALRTPVGWNKAMGAPAAASARLILQRGRLTAIERLRAEGPGLSVASHADAMGSGRNILRIDRLVVGGTEAHGSISLPGGPGEGWRVALSGSTLDASDYLTARAKNAAPASAAPADAAAGDDDVAGPPWLVDLAFDRILLAKNHVFTAAAIHAASDGLRITGAQVSASGIHASVTPAAGGRHVAIDAVDAGAVLLALGVADNIHGGRLELAGSYADLEPHRPLSGTATLTNFSLTDVPAIGRLLQGMTLYGLGDVLRGPGLHFSKLVAPFRWRSKVLHLTSARAFSSSLGITAEGDLDLGLHQADLRGTIVPAYFFNQLLGNLPVLGKLFAPEKGGGLFAANYAVRGSLRDPTVTVNPLSALAPGLLRGLLK